MQLGGSGAALLLALAMATGGPRKSTAQQSSATACIFDFDGDGLVGTDDLLLLLAAFGREASDTRFDAAQDTNGDGVVNAPDLLGLLANFGRVCQADVPPTVTVEQAAAQFEAALAAATRNPSTPLVAVASELALEGDVSDVELGTPARLEFEAAFSVAIAGLLGDGTSCPGTPLLRFLLAFPLGLTARD